MKPTQIYLSLAVIGTVVPWYFFQSYFLQHGLDGELFIRLLFANGAAGGFSADVLISIVVFLYWVWSDAKEQGVKRWWLVVPALFAVGLSLAMPLYLYLRHPEARQ